MLSLVWAPLSRAGSLKLQGEALNQGSSSSSLSQSQGLEATPPCLNPELLPAQAKVPCNSILKLSGGVDESLKAIVSETGISVKNVFHRFKAAAVHVHSLQALRTLHQHRLVVEVIPDRTVSIQGRVDVAQQDSPARASGKGGGKSGGSGGGEPAQVVPEGVLRIGAAPGGLAIAGLGVGVAVVDTGLDYNHPDLALSSPCFTAYSSCQDDNGHGTHVGGIIAALNNAVGVVGVAPLATLYGVKVLDGTGSGSDSGIIAGLDWIASNALVVSPPIRVVNMSFGRTGTLGDNSILRDAVIALKELGITMIVAAGNDASTVVSQMIPAGYPEVLAIASTTAQGGSNGCKQVSSGIAADSASYFTTDGAFNPASMIGVTISAPGAAQEDIKRGCYIGSIGILSLKLGGGLTRMSGSSMAAPHGAGVAALLVEDAGGSIDPELVRSRFRTFAFRIGEAPLDSKVSGYSFDGEREGILSACGVLGVSCP